VSPFYTRKSTEWDTDLLFKKPWDISRKSEFMLGFGPEWVHLSMNGKTSNAIAGELAGDFMFWPTGKHHFGWFLEPAYDYSFAGGHEQSIGMGAGLLIGIRHPRIGSRSAGAPYQFNCCVQGDNRPIIGDPAVKPALRGYIFFQLDFFRRRGSTSS
jgi:hypothetical protein